MFFKFIYILYISLYIYFIFIDLDSLDFFESYVSCAKGPKKLKLGVDLPNRLSLKKALRKKANLMERDVQSSGIMRVRIYYCSFRQQLNATIDSLLPYQKSKGRNFQNTINPTPKVISASYRNVCTYNVT